MTTTIIEEKTQGNQGLNRHTDRCDRCGAQALVRVEMPSGKDLVFCGHHTKAYEPSLVGQGGVIVDDERDTINVKPSVSANAL